MATETSTEKPYVRQDVPRYYKVTPSEIEVYIRCPRKWSFRYRDGILPPARDESASLGDEVHGILEKFQVDGLSWNRSRAGDIALRALPFLPAPDPNARVEWSFIHDFRDGTNLLWKGRVDRLLDPPNYELTVIDFKTTSNFSYAKTETSLLDDPQGIIYSAVALDTFQASKVDLLWLYLHTQKNQERPIRASFTLDTVIEPFRKLKIIGSDLALTFHSSRPTLDLPPTGATNGECDAYRGCPYLFLCNHSPLSASSNTKDEDIIMGFLEDLRAQVSKEPDAPTTPAINPPESIANEIAALAALPDRGVVITTNPAEAEKVVAAITAQIAATVPVADFISQDGGEGDAVPAAPSIEGKRKPGRPRRATTEETPTPASTRRPLTVPPGSTVGFRLYVNCLPRGSVVEVDSFIAMAREKIGYEASTGALVECVRGLLLDHPSVNELFVDASTPEGAALLSMLSHLAIDVVRPVR